MVSGDATSTPITHTCGAIHACTFNKILEGPKPYHQLRVKDGKTLSLDDYRVMLNIIPLGGEGVPFFCIVLVP
jgi:hypothetical protein